MTYYERETTFAEDGTPIFATAEDRRNEEQVQVILEKAWRCELKRLGHLTPIDWYAVRYGRLIGLAELKSRPFASDKYPTVYLGFRKWLALTLGSVRLGCRAVFVCKLTDGVFWIDVAAVDASKFRIGGTKRVVKAVSDIGPMIMVPIASMKRLAVSPIAREAVA